MSLQKRFLRASRSAALEGLAMGLILLACLTPGSSRADGKPKADKGAEKTRTASAAPKGGKVGFARIGLPTYVPPPAYSEDLVIHSKDGDMTMKRHVDHGKIRTEMEAQGQEMVMIEMGDEQGTTVSLMPGEKKAMKQSRAAADEYAAKKGVTRPTKATAEGTPPPDLKVEDLGEETIDGTAAKKIRMTAEGADVLGWFDKATGAPLRMESTAKGEKTAIEWKNRKVGAQPATLFEVPKGYEVMDMDEMYKKMGAMGGMGVGGMAKGMAGGMVQGMGSNLGGSLGSTLGGSLGGPLGAMAGQYIGGKIGGMLGKKAANAIH